MHTFGLDEALLGGALIGVAAVVALCFNGRIAGISGVASGLVEGGRDRGFALPFLLGLIGASAVLLVMRPGTFEAPPATAGSLLRLALAGLLVGFGSRLGGGCTSGHGVCGLSRRSPRSLAATVTFMATAFVVVAVGRHLLGGAL